MMNSLSIYIFIFSGYVTAKKIVRTDPTNLTIFAGTDPAIRIDIDATTIDVFYGPVSATELMIALVCIIDYVIRELPSS